MKDILDIPLVKYGDIRDNVQDGDLIFFIGRHFGDWFLKKHATLNGAKIPCTHVAMARRDMGRLMMLEAVFPVSRMVAVSNFLEAFKGDVIFTKVSLEEKKSSRLRELALVRALDLLGKPYESIPQMSWSFIFKKFGGIEGASQIYCSEYCSLVWRSVGMSLLDEATTLHPAPFQLLESPRLQMLGRLYKE